MAQTMIQLRNKTGVQQNIFIDREVYLIPPLEVRSFRPDIAEAFVRERPQQVERYTEARVPQPQYGERVAWVANASGNPFVPPTVKVRRIEKGEVKMVDVPNGVYTPAIVRRRMQRSQVVIPMERDPNSKECLNLGFIDIEIPPYTRVAVSDSTAEWLIRRDSQQEPQHIGKMRRCRAPTDYEPNEAWDIPQLLFYARLIDIDPKYTAPFETPTEGGSDESVVKAELLKLFFFRLIDPRYNLPTKQQFEALYTAPAVAPAQVAVATPTTTKQAARPGGGR